MRYRKSKAVERGAALIVELNHAPYPVKPVRISQSYSTWNHPKIVIAGAVITAGVLAHAPAAGATSMQVGNYEVQTQKDSGHSWIWAVRPCGVDQYRDTPDCVNVHGIPRPNGQATPWEADAHFSNGRYTMVADIPDGVRCTIYFLPSHDVWSWDLVSLQGTVESSFEKGCGNAPGGTVSYPFSLVRF